MGTEATEAPEVRLPWVTDVFPLMPKAPGVSEAALQPRITSD